MENRVFKYSGCTTTGEYVYRSALMSECGRYRYKLTRVWDESSAPLVFIMLNPSTADAFTDDPTIRRCMGFARREGCGGIEVYNLFAYRATDPRELLKVPLSDLNNLTAYERLRSIPLDAMVICGWGGSGKIGKMADAQFGVVRTKLHWGLKLFCLGKTKDGRPKHPLYLAGDTKIEELIP